MVGSMKWVVATLAAILTVIVLGVTATVSHADALWREFENESMMCSVARPGGAQGATCVISSGPLDGWGFIIHPLTIEVTNASDRVVFRKKTSNTTDTTSVGWAGWQYRNEGVACKRMSYVVSCMLKKGGLLGWSILAADDEIEVSNLDGVTKYHKVK